MAFVRRPVRLVGGDARPIELRTGTTQRSKRREVGLIGPNGVVGQTLTPEQKAEIESKLRAKWERQSNSEKWVRKMMKTKKKKKKK